MMSGGELTPRAMVGTFVDTVREWHYFVGGLALGFLLGAEYARRYHGSPGAEPEG